MKYRRLGTSDIKISCIGLGGNIYGHFCDQRQSTKIIHQAHELGINFIDTADVYSQGLSEKIIGKAIKKNRSKWVIATKVGVKSGESPVGKGKKKYIIQHLEASLKRLKTDYIDIYQMHHYDPETPLEETLGTLNLLIKQGKVRFIGASNYSANQLLESYNIAKQNHFVPFSCIQTHYNILKRKLEKNVLPFCKRTNTSILVYGVLARGVLSGKYQHNALLPPDSRATTSKSVQKDLTPKVIKTVSRLSNYARSKGKTLADLSISWALRLPEVTSLIIGIRKLEYLKCVKAVDWRPNQPGLKQIDSLTGDLQRFKSISLGSFKLID